MSGGWMMGGCATGGRIGGGLGTGGTGTGGIPGVLIGCLEGKRTSRGLKPAPGGPGGGSGGPGRANHRLDLHAHQRVSKGRALKFASLRMSDKRTGALPLSTMSNRRVLAAIVAPLWCTVAPSAAMAVWL